LSQSKLARLADLNATTVNAIERERQEPWSGQAVRIYEALRSFGYEGTREALFEVVKE
jgi:DNA-binding XRE family transcriptional regulator